MKAIKAHIDELEDVFNQLCFLFKNEYGKQVVVTYEKFNRIGLLHTSNKLILQADPASPFLNHTRLSRTLLHEICHFFAAPKAFKYEPNFSLPPKKNLRSSLEELKTIRYELLFSKRYEALRFDSLNEKIIKRQFVGYLSDLLSAGVPHGLLTEIDNVRLTEEMIGSFDKYFEPMQK